MSMRPNPLEQRDGTTQQPGDMTATVVVVGGGNAGMGHGLAMGIATAGGGLAAIDGGRMANAGKANAAALGQRAWGEET